jgi:hypothetical protein
MDVANPASRRLSKYDLADDNDIIEMLLNGPVNLALAADAFDDYDPTPEDHILSCGYSDKVNHAVVLVGYTPDYWIVKNSWGSDWGLSGYVHITRSRTNRANCKIEHSVHIYADVCNITNCVTC